MHLREVGRECIGWIHLAQERAQKRTQTINFSKRTILNMLVNYMSDYQLLRKDSAQWSYLNNYNRF